MRHLEFLETTALLVYMMNKHITILIQPFFLCFINCTLLRNSSIKDAFELYDGHPGAKDEAMLGPRVAPVTLKPSITPGYIPLCTTISV